MVDEYVSETPTTAFYQLGGYNRILKGQNEPGALLHSVNSQTKHTVQWKSVIA